MKVDTVITNAKVVLSSDIVEAGVAISDGKITAISKDSLLPEADRRIDAKGNLLIPGAIDGHLHIAPRPAGPDREDFASVTAAAAVGGVTLVCIMPQGDPLTESGETFRRKKAEFEGQGIVDYSMLGAFSGGEGKDFSKLIPELWQEGAISIKGYMHNHRPERRLKASYDGELLWALEVIAKIGGLASVHCENEFIRTWNMERIMEGKRSDPETFLRFSPPIVEYEAGRRFIYFCKETGARGMVVHSSLPELVMEVENAKRDGYPVYVETLPHFLYFTEDDFKKRGYWFKSHPPVRDKSKVEGLWKMLDKGYIDTISSDHVATPRSEIEEAEKQGDVVNMIPGMPNIEHTVDSIMNGVSRGWVNLLKAVKALAENPARIYGLYPKKGAIQVGSDADLVIVDLNKEMKVTQDTVITKAGWTAYEGMTFRGIPIMTMLRGQVIVQDRQVLGKPGYGEFVPRVDSHK